MYPEIKLDAYTYTRLFVCEHSTTKSHKNSNGKFDNLYVSGVLESTRQIYVTRVISTLTLSSKVSSKYLGLEKQESNASHKIDLT